MPMVYVRSLPFDPPLDAPAVLAGLTDDLAQVSGIEREHITITWEYFEPGHYAQSGQAPAAQPAASHPVLAEVFAPDFYAPPLVERMLSGVAQSIGARTRVSAHNVFVSYRSARSGEVFEEGELVRW